MKPLKLITILGIAILISFPSLAFAKKPPKPPVDDVIEYTVELTTGVFTFPFHRVTMNSREYLKSLYPDQLVIGRPLDNPDKPDELTDEQVTWDAVIDNCAGPLMGDPTIYTMVVDFDEWAVGRNGDDGFLWINLKSIRLPTAESPEKEIQIILRLKNATTADYPPTADDPDQTFYLDSYVIWGKPLSGMSVKGKNKGWDTCYHSDLESDVNFPIAELEIKYIGVK